MSLGLDVSVNNPIFFKAETCPICLEDMWSSTELPCGHRYHAKCIDAWLIRQMNCPYCRGSFLPVSDASSSVFLVTFDEVSLHSDDYEPPPPPPPPPDAEQRRDNALCAKVFRFCFGMGRR